jgi:hypothetical protein
MELNGVEWSWIATQLHERQLSALINAAAETVADEEEETEGSYLESSLSPNALEVGRSAVEEHRQLKLLSS